MTSGVYQRKPLADRFWEKVKKTKRCWLWTATVEEKGYGQITVNYKTTPAHRLSWRMANGTIPAGMCVLHKCDTPSCVRPSHLYLGTFADNMRDMISKGRARHPEMVRGYHGRYARRAHLT